MTKEQKIALLQEMLLEAPRSFAPTIRSLEQVSDPEQHLTDEEWDGLFEWLDEVHPDDE